MDLLLRSEKDPKKIAQSVINKAAQVAFILEKWHELVDFFDGDINRAKTSVFYYQHILDDGFAKVPNSNFSLEYVWREVATAWGLSGKAAIRNFGTMFITDVSLYTQMKHNPCLIDSDSKWSNTFHCEHTVGNQHKTLEHLEEWLTDPVIPSPKQMAKQAMIETIACTILMKDKGKVQGSEENNSRHPFKRYGTALKQKVMCFSNGTVRDATNWSLSTISTAILEDDFLGSVYRELDQVQEKDLETIRSNVVEEHSKREPYHQIPADMSIFVKLNPFELQDIHYTHHSYKTYDSSSKNYFSQSWTDARNEWKKNGTLPKSLWDKENLFYPE